MSSQEVSSGPVLPYATIAVAGKGRAVAVLLITFMAVTSNLSAQIIGVSSIISFDIYRTYFQITRRTETLSPGAITASLSSP
jgi:Na+/proline symporter